MQDTCRSCARRTSGRRPAARVTVSRSMRLPRTTYTHPKDPTACGCRNATTVSAVAAPKPSMTTPTAAKSDQRRRRRWSGSGEEGGGAGDGSVSAIDTASPTRTALPLDRGRGRSRAGGRRSYDRTTRTRLFIWVTPAVAHPASPARRNSAHNPTVPVISMRM
jgi:hypothetical protein